MERKRKRQGDRQRVRKNTEKEIQRVKEMYTYRERKERESMCEEDPSLSHTEEEKERVRKTEREIQRVRKTREREK